MKTAQAGVGLLYLSEAETRLRYPVKPGVRFDEKALLARNGLPCALFWDTPGIREGGNRRGLERRPQDPGITVKVSG
jgi:hypothetical protein